MSRNIKFRAWDGEKMRGIKPHDWFSIRSDAMLSFWGRDGAPEPVLMQFTGLLDKNGKEVYEHDVIRNAYGDLGEVIYSDTCGILGGWTYQFAARGDQWSTTMGFHQADPDEEQECDFEVIGNIFENPELVPRAPG